MAVKANDLLTIIELEAIPSTLSADSVRDSWIEQTYTLVQALQGQSIRSAQIDRALLQGELAEKKPLTMKQYMGLQGNLYQRLISLRQAHLSPQERQERHTHRKRVGRYEFKGHSPLALQKLVYLINEESSKERKSAEGSTANGALTYGYAHYRQTNGIITLDTYIPLARIRYQKG